MMIKRMKLDTVLFAAAMITISGACLAYNIRTAETGELTASLSELAAISDVREIGVVSAAAVARLGYNEAIAVSATPTEVVSERVLLPPVITEQS